MTIEKAALEFRTVLDRAGAVTHEVLARAARAQGAARRIADPFRKALERAGAGKRAELLEARARALETENERLRNALTEYHRAAYLTLSRSNGLFDSRVKINGEWHHLEHKLPWYRKAIDELDMAYARVRQIVGEPHFAMNPAGQREPVRAAAIPSAGRVEDMRHAA